MKKRIWLFLLPLCISVGGFAQKVINTTGKSITGNNLQVSYSVGEIAITPFKNGQGSVTQGLLQPFEFRVATNEPFDQQYTLRCFPNPTVGNLTIETDYKNFKIWQIVSMNGQVLSEQTFNYQPLDVANLPVGSHLLILRGENNISKTIKIVKQ